jgi:hypothetical protein
LARVHRGPPELATPLRPDGGVAAARKTDGPAGAGLEPLGRERQRDCARRAAARGPGRDLRPQGGERPRRHRGERSRANPRWPA